MFPCLIKEHVRIRLDLTVTHLSGSFETTFILSMVGGEIDYQQDDYWEIQNILIHETQLQIVGIETCPVAPCKVDELGWELPEWKELSIRSIINATSDLDICKSCWDGKNLYIRSWHKLFGRYDYIKNDLGLIRNGYKTNEDGQDDSPDDYPDAIKDRLEKYTQRGFNIIHPLNHLIRDHIKSALETPGIGSGIDAVKNNLVNLDLFFME